MVLVQASGDESGDESRGKQETADVENQALTMLAAHSVLLPPKREMRWSGLDTVVSRTLEARTAEADGIV